MSGRDYYGWLMDIVDGPWKYSRVITELWNTDFYSKVPMDDNRAKDGLKLRNHFENETGQKCEKGGKCSVLEMMIGLAKRIEDEYMYDYELGDQTSDWFWEMFYNLGLDRFDDFSFDRGQILQIIYDFLDRKYGQRGQNCLFPTKHRRKNLEDVEIWWQMNDYISEKFG